MILKYNRLIFSVIIILIFTTEVAFSAEKVLPVETDILWEREFYYMSPCDFNNDSTDELIIIENDHKIQPYDQRLYPKLTSRLFETATFRPRVSICGGLRNRKIMWATYNRNDSMFLFDLWGKRKIFITKGIDIAKPKDWDGIASQVELTKLNNEGELKAILLVNSDTDLKPRGIFVLDWKSKKFLWKFLCGPNIDKFLIKDIDADKKSEILCGTVALDNGNVVNGTDDAHTYVFMLNHDGKLRWSTRIGVYSSTALVGWLENKVSGRLKIIVVEKDHFEGDRVCDSVFVLDALTGQILERAKYGQFNSGYAINYNNKGEPQIFIGGSDDTLRTLNENLKLVNKHFVNGDGIWHIASYNFSGLPGNEIMVYTNRGFLCLYNSKFKLLSKYPTRMIYRMIPLTYYGNPRLLLNLDRDNRTVWQLLDFETTPLFKRSLPLIPVMAFLVLIVIGATFWSIYMRYLRIRDIRMLIRSLVGQAGVIELNRKNDVISINQYARSILEITDKKQKINTATFLRIPQAGQILNIARIGQDESNQVSEGIISIKPGQTYLARYVKTRTGGLITLEDITTVEYLKRITTWVPVAQKLAHGIKNPLSTILGAAEQIEVKVKEIVIKKYIGYIKDEVTKLRKMTDSFMRFTKQATPHFQFKNLNDIIINIMRKYETAMPDRIKVEYGLQDNLPLLSVDEEGISTALDITIENAIEAMGEKGSLKIITTIAKQPDSPNRGEIDKEYIKIIILDSGAGIPEKYLKKVFEPYFSYNKPLGTGLGLSLAKKIIEDHKGYISINSKESVGTEVNIYLPIQK